MTRAERGQARARGPRLALVAAILAVTVAVVGVAPAEAVVAREFVRSFGNPPLQAGDFAEPFGIGIDAGGQVYVLDVSAGWMQVFDADGTYLRGWAAPGGQRIAMSPVTGHPFVVHPTACRITEYTSLGATVRTFGTATCGSAQGQLSEPTGVAVASDGEVYVTEYGSDRVQVFDAGGAFARSWSVTDPRDLAVGPGGDVYVAFINQATRYTSSGTLVGQFSGTSINTPNGIATGADGSVYVAQTFANRVKKFTASGAFVTEWGGGQEDSGPGSIDGPRQVAVSPKGDVYVVDARNLRVQRFTDTGAWVGEFGTYVRAGRLRDPAGVAIDSAGNVYVSDQRNHQVQVFGSDGSFLRRWSQTAPGQRLSRPGGIDVADGGDVYVANTDADRIERFTAAGDWVASIGVGQFAAPTEVAVGGGHLNVADGGAGKIKQFTLDGTFVREWGSGGAAHSTFHTLAGVAVAPDGSVFAVDQGRDQVQQFTATGAFVRTWGAAGSGPGQFITPQGVGVDATGDVYVGDCGSDRIQRFSPTGEMLDVLGSGGSGDGQFSCPVDLAFAGSDLYVADRNTTPTPNNDRIQQFAYPATALVAVDLAVDETDVAVGDTVHLHVSIDNLADTPLTGVATTSPTTPDCARTLPDLAPFATVTFDCTYVAATSDPPRFTTSVTVETAESPPVTSDEVSVEVGHDPRLHVAREWSASASSLPDTDPIAPAGAGHGGQGLAVDAAGRVFVAGSRDYPRLARVARFGADGVFAGQWGTTGQDAGELWYPDAVAVAPDGDVFTTECDVVHRVQRFSGAGAHEHTWDVSPSPSGACSPADVAVGPDGTAYVVNAADDRIDRIVGDTYSPGWGTPGSGDGQFDRPQAVAAAPDGTVYVADAGNRRVQRFDPTGQFLGAFGVAGTANGQFVDPRDLAVTDDGWVVVADFGDSTGGGRVQVFSPTGAFLAKVPVRTDDVAVHTDGDGIVHLYTYPHDGDEPLGVVREYVSAGGVAPYLTATLTPEATQVNVRGTVDYELAIHNVGATSLTGMTVDAGSLDGCSGAAGDLVVGASVTLTCTLEAGADDVGRYHAHAVVDSDQTAPFRTANTGVEVLVPVLRHWGEDRLESPRGAVANWQGDLWVADCQARAVVRYTTDGQFVSQWSTVVAGDEGGCPVDITLFGDGNLLVADRDLLRVQEFTPSGALVGMWATGTVSDYGELTSLDTTDDDGVYVADNDHGFYGDPCGNDQWGVWVCTQYPPNPANNRVRLFTPTGASVGNWIRQVEGVATTPDGEVLVTGGSVVEVHRFDGALLASFTNAGTPQTTGRVVRDRHGYVWVTYPSADLVRKFTRGGTELARWSINNPRDVAVDRDHVYVLDAAGGVTKLGGGPGGAGTISGTVTDAVSGAVVSGAQVAVLEPATFTLVGGATAGSDGVFQAEVAPGTYYLAALDPSGDHAAALLGPPTAVIVADGGSATADPVMAPVRGAVAGTLVEDGTGDPVPGAWALALDGTTGAPERGAIAGAGGDYDLGRLVPGNHLLAFVDPAGGHVPEFFPGAADVSGATPVAVTAGATAAADGSLATQAPNPGGATLSGEVVGIGSDNGFRPLAYAGVIALAAADYRFVAATVTDGDGDYQLDVPPGAYKLLFLDSAGHHQAEWSGERRYDQLAAAASVTAPSTVARAFLNRRTGEVSGHVLGAESGQGIGGAWVIASGAQGIVSTTAAADGSYRLVGLEPGTFQLLYVDPSGAHAAQVWRDHLYPSPGDPLSITTGRSIHYDAELGP